MELPNTRTSPKHIAIMVIAVLFAAALSAVIPQLILDDPALTNGDDGKEKNEKENGAKQGAQKKEMVKNDTPKEPSGSQILIASMSKRLQDQDQRLKEQEQRAVERQQQMSKQLSETSKQLNETQTELGQIKTANDTLGRELRLANARASKALDEFRELRDAVADSSEKEYDNGVRISVAKPGTILNAPRVIEQKWRPVVNPQTYYHPPVVVHQPQIVFPSPLVIAQDYVFPY